MFLLTPLLLSHDYLEMTLTVSPNLVDLYGSASLFGQDAEGIAGPQHPRLFPSVSLYGDPSENYLPRANILPNSVGVYGQKPY